MKLKTQRIVIFLVQSITDNQEILETNKVTLDSVEEATVVKYVAIVTPDKISIHVPVTTSNNDVTHVDKEPEFKKPRLITSYFRPHS